MKTSLIRGLAATLALAATPALAQSAGHWTTAYGAGLVAPKSDNGTLAGLQAEIDDAPALSFSYEYMLRNNLGFEVHALLGGPQDVALQGAGKVGSYWSFAPSFLLQYHFNGYGSVSPFVGVGVNYTLLAGEDSKGALAGADLDFKDSYGAAAHVGVDFAFGERSAIRVDARWTDLRSKVEVDGVRVGKAQVDPLTYGISYVLSY
jgi:outer membrane protein